MGIEENLSSSQLRIIPLQKLSASRIAAITEYIQYNSKEPTLAFFQWNKAITLANYQSAEDVNLELAKKNNYQIVRLLGGGRAYIHNNDISFLLILPNYHQRFSAEENYSFVATRFIQSFNYFGLNSELKNAKKYGYDVYANGKILLGLASNIDKNSLMIHGAFYYNQPDYNLSIKLIKDYSLEDAVLLKKNVGYFLEHSDAKLDDLINTIIKSFSNNYFPKKLSNEELKEIDG
ncbi:MAG: hypothetical protein PHN56_05400, partial [Candidatus Nanoarchaeia archaeon]|nr:hypothetical protein [Candidatus Nanoarchaeia archaeon]